jgi:inosine-uridine nucleoside N-ribohydrolase
MSALLSASLLCLSAQVAAAPVILDTDLGDDIDDTWALCMMLGCPQIELELIVTASDDTAIKTRLVAKILERIGRTDIPLGMGKKTSENAIHQAEWLGDYQLDAYKGVVHEDGVQALIELINASKEKVTLCVIGPQTNIAEALRRDPSIAEKARVVSMAGSVHIGYAGKQGRDPEWNVFKDIEAARAVFAAPWEITYAPLDTCGTLILKGDRYAAVANAKTPRAITLMENYAQWSNRKHHPADQSSVLFDTEAVYLIFADDYVEMQTVKLSIDDKGNTVPDDEKGRPVRCALQWKNLDAYEALLVQSLTQEPSGPSSTTTAVP